MSENMMAIGADGKFAGVIIPALVARGAMVRKPEAPDKVHTSPAFLPYETEVRKAMIGAAIAAGVRRFVFSSVIPPVVSWLSNHAMKAIVEEAILDCDLEYEVLGRPIQARRLDPATLGPEAAPPRPMFDHYDHISLRGIALTLRIIPSRESRMLRAFFEELAAGRSSASDGSL